MKSETSTATFYHMRGKQRPVMWRHNKTGVVVLNLTDSDNDLHLAFMDKESFDTFFGALDSEYRGLTQVPEEDEGCDLDALAKVNDFSEPKAPESPVIVHPPQTSHTTDSVG